MHVSVLSAHLLLKILTVCACFCYSFCVIPVLTESVSVCVFLQQRNLEGYVGFANLPNQVYRKSVKRGFEFTLMVVGKLKTSTSVPWLWMWMCVLACVRACAQTYECRPDYLCAFECVFIFVWMWVINAGWREVKNAWHPERSAAQDDSLTI